MFLKTKFNQPHHVPAKAKAVRPFHRSPTLSRSELRRIVAEILG